MIKLPALKQNNFVTAAEVIGGGILLFIAYKQFKKLSEYIKLAQTQSLMNTTVTSGGEIIDLGSTAAGIYDALYNNDWFAFIGTSYTEDEQRIIDLITSVPNTYIPKLVSTYFKLYQRVLKADLIKALSDDEYLLIKDKFI